MVVYSVFIKSFKPLDFLISKSKITSCLGKGKIILPDIFRDIDINYLEAGLGCKYQFDLMENELKVVDWSLFKDSEGSITRNDNCYTWYFSVDLNGEFHKENEGFFKLDDFSLGTFRYE